MVCGVIVACSCVLDEFFFVFIEDVDDVDGAGFCGFEEFFVVFFVEFEEVRVAFFAGVFEGGFAVFADVPVFGADGDAGEGADALWFIIFDGKGFAHGVFCLDGCVFSVFFLKVFKVLRGG